MTEYSQEFTIDSPIFADMFKKMLLQATIAHEQAEFVRSRMWYEQYNFYPT